MLRRIVSNRWFAVAVIGLLVALPSIADAQAGAGLPVQYSQISDEQAASLIYFCLLALASFMGGSGSWVSWH